MLKGVFWISILLSTLIVIGCASKDSYEQLSYHLNTVFYISPVTQEQAQKVVDLYVKNSYFNGPLTKSIGMTIAGDPKIPLNRQDIELKN